VRKWRRPATKGPLCRARTPDYRHRVASPGSCSSRVSVQWPWRSPLRACWRLTTARQPSFGPTSLA